MRVPLKFIPLYKLGMGAPFAAVRVNDPVGVWVGRSVPFEMPPTHVEPRDRDKDCNQVHAPNKHLLGSNGNTGNGDE
ncbi:hypothetical protein ACVWWI_001522 [Bradyrhizobium sp. USDA 3686]|uniref:hypothetical protein n=1 Tax=Bradyrhizobium TaxID=374 RepID=UPI001956D2F3|nr:hypothetical protein [Bradyrhizobium canariense]MBM7485154.1 hypothetical protein [Bradyrhizobium canariense]UFW73747.1 hypothetical protein BcanWU425_08370 [Bradyrhizobium canariense]